MEAFILILMIVGVGITIAAVKSAGDNSDAVWKAASQRLGLGFDRTNLSNSPVVSGTRRGLFVRIDTHAKTEDLSRTYTRYRVSFEKPLGLGLRLTLRVPTTRSRQERGIPTILTGDEEFDGVVVVKGYDHTRVVDFLTPIRKRRIVRHLDLYPDSAIDDVRIESSTRDMEHSPDRIVQMVQRMTDLAEHLTEDDAQKEDTEPPRSFVEAPHAIDEEMLPEVEPPDFDEQSSEKSVAAEPPCSDEVGPKFGSVIDMLYGQGQTTSQTTEVFERHLKGESVEWSGTLTNVRSFRFDIVFGAVPGTRAEIRLVEPEEASATGRPIVAVVQCPVDVEDRLRALTDRPVVLRGTLLSCDAFMKILFLTGGQIDEVDR